MIAKDGVLLDARLSAITCTRDGLHEAAQGKLGWQVATPCKKIDRARTFPSDLPVFL